MALYKYASFPFSLSWMRFTCAAVRAPMVSREIAVRLTPMTVQNTCVETTLRASTALMDTRVTAYLDSQVISLFLKNISRHFLPGGGSSY